MALKCFLFIILSGLLYNRVCDDQINHINFVDYIRQPHHKYLFICMKQSPACTGE